MFWLRTEYSQGEQKIVFAYSHFLTTILSILLGSLDNETSTYFPQNV